MKTGIVGAGTIVPDFLEASKNIKDIEVQSISATAADMDRMKELSDKYGIEKIFTDYKELLADDVEIVYIAVPNHLHYIFAKQAIEAKKNVILEKPFASSYAQAKNLIELAAANNVVIFEAISNQFLPNYTKTKELVPQLGDMKIVQLNYSQYSRRYDLFKQGTTLPVFDPKKSGGALMDLNIYNIHFVVGLFGAPQKVSYIANIEKGIDTSGILTMEYPTFKCVVVGAKDCKSPVSINLQGDKGCIYSNNPANVYNDFTYSTNDGQDESFSLNNGENRLYFEIAEFVDIVKNNNTAKLKVLNDNTLTVMKIADEGRKQVGIEIQEDLC